ncbi:MAG: hypothetical protein LBN27_03060 [Prevotellaceae bacterium]|jgi:hypothetical protein|nr:hypothetical protein [Prevotellaceae bacterium]
MPRKNKLPIQNKTKYADALANKNDLLWIYFLYRDGSDIVVNFQKLFTKNKSQNIDSVLTLAYGINPDLPYQTTNEDGKVFDCQEVEDVINVSYSETLSDESWEALTKESFRTWLRQKDPAIAGKLLSTPGHDTNPWCVLYNLSPKVSFSLQMDEKADDYFYDLNAICSFLDDCMIDYIKSGMDEDGYDSGILDQVCDMDDTQLYYYMKSKGWDRQINWIRETMNTETKENEDKYAPNNWRICFYKALKGLDYDPAYYFPDSDKYIFSLDELKDIPPKEILDELEKGCLEDYLTIFFHENPFLDLKPKFTFEKETVKYLEKLEELNPDDTWVHDFRIGTSEVEGKVKKNKRMKSTHLWCKVLFGLLTFALTAFTIYKAAGFVVPTFDTGWWGAIPAIIVAIAVCWYCINEEYWSLFWSLVVAALAFVIVNAIVKYAVIYLNYVVPGVLLLWLIFAGIKGLVKSNPFKYISSKIKELDFEGQYLEPLHFAFKAEEDDIFKSSVTAKYDGSIYQIKEALKKFFLHFVPLFVVSALLLGTMIHFSPKLAEMTQQMNLHEQFIGKYVGKFENREATLDITKFTEKEAEAAITVKYNTPLHETLKGAIDLENNTFHFDDIVSNGNLDGEYNGTLNQETKTLAGDYRNYKTKKKVIFEFSKINH